MQWNNFGSLNAQVLFNPVSFFLLRQAGRANLLLYPPSRINPNPQLIMSSQSRMSALEIRASLALASVFGLRLFGMFVILPVFAIYAEALPGGSNLTLVGVEIGRAHV